jgi:uncharacterized Rmd1/YagE family protein
MSNFSHDRLSIYNIGDTFSSDEILMDKLSIERGVRFRDAVQISTPTGEYWIFDYGIVVFWGIKEDERQALINQITSTDINSQTITVEHFRFEFSNELKITKDTIYLPNEHHLTRLAISHALAQSTKLIEYENQAQNSIIEYAHLPQALAKTGRISLSRKEIAKIRGKLFSTKSDIILHYGLLDTPEFFWEYPEYEPIYTSLSRYLDIHPRVELLSKKLETIHELFQMLADEQKHQHSSILEWIIIILIAIEIVIFIGEKL